MVLVLFCCFAGRCRCCCCCRCCCLLVGICEVVRLTSVGLVFVVVLMDHVIFADVIARRAK